MDTSGKSRGIRRYQSPSNGATAAVPPRTRRGFTVEYASTAFTSALAGRRWLGRSAHECLPRSRRVNTCFGARSSVPYRHGAGRLAHPRREEAAAACVCAPESGRRTDGDLTDCRSRAVAIPIRDRTFGAYLDCRTENRRRDHPLPLPQRVLHWLGEVGAHGRGQRPIHPPGSG